MRLRVLLFRFGVLSLVLSFAGCLGFDAYLESRVSPPPNVTNIVTCLDWLEKPRGAYKVTADKTVYYQITGPSGRFLASGPSAYSFDSQGKFIGWTTDMGDIRDPPEAFGGAREDISFEEIRKVR